MGAPNGQVPWNKGKGLGWTDKRGYRWRQVDGKKMREHRFVMEQHLGRKLTVAEVVHHINGDTSDNRVENLEVVRDGDHSRDHHLGAKRPDETKKRIARAARDRELIRELYEALRALVAGCEYSTAMGVTGWHVKRMPRDNELDAARTALAKVTTP